MKTSPTLRVARPSDNLEALITFYRDGLGLDVLYRFEDHDGFDGIMIGSPAAPYHFEFTRAHGHVAGRAPTQDNLLVFYLPAKEEWRAAVDRMETAGFTAVPAFNAYWDQHGRTFEDPDGYRIVIQNTGWNT
jgi:catechol 2,3-dioxygenase-like lactoylglutathione lyase family enzyme